MNNEEKKRKKKKKISTVSPEWGCNSAGGMSGDSGVVTGAERIFFPSQLLAQTRQWSLDSPCAVVKKSQAVAAIPLFGPRKIWHTMSTLRRQSADAKWKGN